MIDSESVLLALNQLKGLKTRDKLRLCEFIKTPEDFLNLDRRLLQSLTGRPCPLKESPGDLLEEARRQEEKLRQSDASFLFYWDSRYPPLLKEIYNPPFLLFFRGTLPPREPFSCAVVGTRHPGLQGSREAYGLAVALARQGHVLVSGLALGIDVAAHQGAVDARGVTAAVLGSGIDSITPWSNRKTAWNLLSAGGCLFSEYPPGTPARRHHFPQRNRIISGLSQAVVVIEAPRRSGSLITADFALDQGRDLFLYAPTFVEGKEDGLNRLWNQGAPLISRVEDILSHDPGSLPRQKETPGTGPRKNMAKQLAENMREEIEGTRLFYRGGYY